MTTTEFTMIDLTTMKTEDLKKLAKDYKVKNWWLLKKADLIASLTDIQLDLEDKVAVQKANEEYQKELGLDKEVPQEENPMAPMPGTQDHNCGEKDAGKDSKKAKTTKAPKVEKDQDNLVTIKELAAEFNMKGTKARRLLRNESALRPFGSNRWEWDKVLHTGELDKVREILKDHSK